MLDCKSHPLLLALEFSVRRLKTCIRGKTVYVDWTSMGVGSIGELWNSAGIWINNLK